MIMRFIFYGSEEVNQLKLLFCMHETFNANIPDIYYYHHPRPGTG